MHRLKLGSYALIGIIIGVLIGAPLVYYYSRQGVKYLYGSAKGKVDRVENRMQAMADVALELHRTLDSLGWKGDVEPFEKVETWRARLTGSDQYDYKVEAIQDLERSLLLVERVWFMAGQKDPMIGSSVYWKKHGRTWEELKRLLVVEEQEMHSVIIEYNSILKTWTGKLVQKDQPLFGLADAVEELKRANIEAEYNEDGQLLIHLSEKALRFDFGLAQIRPDGEEVLEDLAEILEKHGDITIAIEGHTDAIGSDKDNQKLSQERALAVKKFLIERGIPEQNFKAVKGWGEKKPIADNDTEKGRAQNRRVDIQVDPVAAPEFEPIKVKLQFPPLPVPYFLADAPPPESAYGEIQYSDDMNMVDVELGSDPNVMQNRKAPGAFKAIVSEKQSKVRY